MLSVWLYGYALGITSERRIEQRRVEDLGFRYLAGGAGVDNGALSRFRRRHGRGINDVFTSGRSYAVRSGGGKKLVVGTTANRAGGEWRCEKQSGQTEGEGKDGENARGELEEREVFFERA